MVSPVRYPAGVSTAAKGSALFNLPYPHPAKAYMYFNDFDTFVTGNWTTTRVGTTPTETLVADEPFGALALTISAADNDSDQIQLTTENFTVTAGKKLWYETRLKVSDATQSDFVFGLCVLDTTLLGAVDGDGFTDGIYFAKEDGDTQLDVGVQQDTTTGQSRSTNIATVDTSYHIYGFEYDGVSSTSFWVDGVKKATVSSTSAFIPNTPVTVSFAMMNGEAVAKVMTIDYVVAAIER